MGSIISAIEDKISEHGSLENYKKHLKETAFVPQTVLSMTTGFPLGGSEPKRAYPIFRDSKGREVWDGTVIKILNHQGNSNLNGETAVVKWNSTIGGYEYQLDSEIRNPRAFSLVSSFVVFE